MIHQPPLVSLQQPHTRPYPDPPPPPFHGQIDVEMDGAKEEEDAIICATTPTVLATAPIAPTGPPEEPPPPIHGAKQAIAHAHVARLAYAAQYTNEPTT